MGFLDRLKRNILPTREDAITQEVTNTILLNELLDCFEDSLKKESVGSSLLFNAHYLIILHPDTYEARLASLPVVVKEAVKVFYKRLAELKNSYKEITPISSNWQFKFAPGVEFNGESIKLNDVMVIGMLTGLKEITSRENVTKTKVTMKPKKTNVYDKLDINLASLKNIDFRESGAFTVKFNADLQMGSEAPPKRQGAALASIEYISENNETQESYQMLVKEIVIARKEADNLNYSNYLLIASNYISNPHARLRYNENSRQFQIASFSRNETRVNERIIPQSEITNPQWFDLPNPAKILLNGLITLSFESNL